MPKNTTPETFNLQLRDMAHGGSALGRHQGRIVFVPYTIPGETVEVRLTGEKGKVAFGEGLRLVEASADRVFPQCPHFTVCGRCHWQHIDYPAQLLLKQDVLADQLERVGGFKNARVRPVIAAPDRWGYNYHMLLHRAESGTLGFMDPAGKRVIAIEECHIIHPDLQELYVELDLDFGGFERITLQRGSDGSLMLILQVQDEEDVPELSADIPASVNIVLPDNEPVNLIGDSHVVYRVGAREFRVTAGSDFRANVAQLEPLAQLVLDLLDLSPDDAVLDLYAGVGFFSAFIAPHVSLVTLVESYPPAVTDADENLSDFDHVDLVEGTVEDVLGELDERYQAVVVDPPSSGLSRDALAALLALDIPRLVYISSDPASFARDLKQLNRQGGYRLRKVHPIDLAPQTYFIDAVALLSKPQQS